VFASQGVAVREVIMAKGHGRVDYCSMSTSRPSASARPSPKARRSPGWSGVIAILMWSWFWRQGLPLHPGHHLQPHFDPAGEHRIVQFQLGNLGSLGHVEVDEALDRVARIDLLKHELG
jgi:hypothetical protein